MEGVALNQEVPDQVRWKLTHCRVYSSKLAYAAFSVRTIKFSSWKKDLEKLGSSSLQVLHLVSDQQQVLDY
jgi:hypothetical protein